jgi:hypothetical protein
VTNWIDAERARLYNEAEVRAQEAANEQAARRAELLRRIDEHMLRSRFDGKTRHDEASYIVAAVALIVLAVVFVATGAVRF